MSLTKFNYAATGSPQTLPIPFDYIDPSHVAVAVDNVLQVPDVNYTLDSGSINITATEGSVITIQRLTPITNRLTDYQDGVPLTEPAMDVDSKQPLYLLQELTDEVNIVKGEVQIIVDEIAGGGGENIQTGLTIADEGTPLGAPGTVNTLNFSGKGITAVRVADAVVITVPGPGGFTYGAAPPSISDVDDGHRFLSDVDFKEYVAVNDGSSRQWVEKPSGSGGGGGGQKFFYQSATVDGVPEASAAGDEWVDTDSGIKYTWVDDGTSAQWVEFGEGGALPAPPASAVDKVLQFACSDETTALTAGTTKVTLRAPYAMTLTAVRASLSTAQSSGAALTVDVNKGGGSILATKITFDNGERTSVTATTQPVISTPLLLDDDEITVDIDQVGDGTAKGLKITLIGS